MHRFRITVLLALLCALLATAVGAQDAPAVPAVQLDAAKAVLDQVEASLARSNISDTALQGLRTQIQPADADLQAVVGELGPRLDAAKARLAQLGPKPEAGKATEAAEITAERDAQQKLFNDLDATIKRAKVLSVQADQLDARIVAKRRLLFTNSVLAQSYSLLDPRLWGPVFAELPSDMRALGYLGQDWWTDGGSRLTPWQALAAFGLLLAIVVAGHPVRVLARRVTVRHEGAKAPSALRRVSAALWVALVSAALPSAAVLLARLDLSAFGLVTPRFEPIAAIVVRATLFVAVTTGLARGFFSPRATVWRIPPMTDFGAERLYRLAIVLAGAVALTRVLEAIGDAIALGLPAAVATRGLIAAFATAGIGYTLHQLGLAESAGANKSIKRSGRNWSGPLRLLFWCLIAVQIAALLTGYIAFAAFFLVQIAICSALAILLAMLLILTDAAIGAGFEPNRALGRAFTDSFGLRRESLDQIGILLSGAIRVVLIVVAVLLALAPWRIESGDMFSIVQAAFFGFSIGDVTISLSAVIVAGVLFLVAIAATRGVQRWLEVKYLPRTRLDTGLQNSIKTSLGYLGVLIAASLALSHLGLSFERLAIVAGALSVGIGFGLQSIVNNFVSGLILLWERAIRVGDWVVVGDEQGYVKRINVRSTEIETFDRATIIVPNSNLVSGVVKNWLRNDHVGRIRLPFTFGIATDPEQVREILISAAKEHEHVLAIPSPQVNFAALGETNLRLELICFIEDIESATRVSSDLLFAVTKGFRDVKLIAPPGLPVVTSPVLEKLDAWLSAKTVEPRPAVRATEP